MSHGKKVCKILKEIRRQIAEKNDIALVISECHFQGECKGTCPKCEAEVRYLEKELNKRKQLGKAVAIAGISLGVAGTFADCGTPKQDNTQTAEQELLTESVNIDTVSVIPADSLKNEIDLIPWDFIPLDGLISKSPIFGYSGEEYPHFEEIYTFFTNNAVYPKEAIENGIEGTVLLEFIMENDGTISNVKMLQDIGYGCGEEAVRVIKKMPIYKFDKSERKGMPFQFPVQFILPDKHKDSL